MWYICWHNFSDFPYLVAPDEKSEHLSESYLVAPDEKSEKSSQSYLVAPDEKSLKLSQQKVLLISLAVTRTLSSTHSQSHTHTKS